MIVELKLKCAKIYSLKAKTNGNVPQSIILISEFAIRLDKVIFAAP